MEKQLPPGDITELKIASERGVAITLIQKDFSKSIIDNLKFSDSIIAKNNFIGTTMYNCKFIDCEFTKDNFTDASLSIIEFINCSFFGINFSNCSLSNISFKNCTFHQCNFVNIKLLDNVIGLSDDDLNVINEQNEEYNEKYKPFTDYGFVKQNDDTFKMDLGDNVECICSLDTEMGDDVWRAMFFIENECLYSDTFILDEDFDSSYFNKLIKFGKKLALKKLSEI